MLVKRAVRVTPDIVVRRRPRRDLFAVGENHAAFARSKRLSHLKAESPAIADGPSAHALPLGTVGVRTVGDDGDIVLGRNRLQRIHVARHAAVVNRHDGAGLGRNGGCDGVRVDGVVARIAVHENGNGVGLQDRRSRGHKCNGGDNDLVPRFHTHCAQRRLEGDGAVGHSDAVFGVLKCGKVTLEASHLGLILVGVSAPPPNAALQHALQQRLFIVAEDRPGYAQRRFNGRGSASQRQFSHSGMLLRCRHYQGSRAAESVTPAKAGVHLFLKNTYYA